jgi:polyisoprenyl-teichoic acid--peptidoglycan teichoic acid transferase
MLKSNGGKYMRSEKKQKRKGKWKIIGFSFLGVFILAAAAIGVGYYQLQPKNHFKTIPVVSSPDKKGKTETQPQSTTNSVPPFNILLMGSDARPGQTIGHSDTMMLMHVDISKSEVNAVSIPRDTRVYLDGYGYTKLTSVQYILQAKKGPKQGIEEAVQAISNLTGVPINYYAETNFEGFQSMVDTLGGIEMTVPMDVNIGSQTISTGTHFLDGETVLALVRERHSLANGDYGRQLLQLEALKGIAKGALSRDKISKLPSLAGSATKNIIGTNISTSDMVSFGLAAKNFDFNKEINYQQLQGVGKSMYDDILKANNDEIVIDPQHIKDVFTKDFQS